MRQAAAQPPGCVSLPNPSFGPNPEYVPLVRACDDPEKNFQRLRGVWTDSEAEKTRARQRIWENNQREIAPLKRKFENADVSIPVSSSTIPSTEVRPHSS